MSLPGFLVAGCAAVLVAGATLLWHGYEDRKEQRDEAEIARILGDGDPGDPTITVPLRERISEIPARLADLWQSTTPRSPELVAYEAYLDSSDKDAYVGRHRFPEEASDALIRALTMSTGEMPTVIRLNADWKEDVQVPELAEVFT